MNPFDDTDQELPEAFADHFADPTELLAPDEDVNDFNWPVDRVPTAAAVDEIAPELDAETRAELVARLDDVSAHWVRRSDWDALP
jgi:hypothetical protein